MKAKVRIGMILLALLILTGCNPTGAGIAIKFDPNPIVLKPGDSSIKGTLSIRSSGVGFMDVESIVVELINGNGDPIIINGEKIQKMIRINKTIPVIGFSISEQVELPVSYEDVRKWHVDHVRISVLGSRPTTLKVFVEYQ